MYVKNTFIEIAHDDGKTATSSHLPAAAVKRSTSTPPNISIEIEWRERFDLKPKTEYLLAEEVCATPCIFSPRSDYSTAASSERNGMTLPTYAPTSSDSECATDASSPAFSASFPHSDQVALDAVVAAAEQESPRRETSETQDGISTGELKDFCITLNKGDGTSLGIDVDRSDGITLFIRCVKAGLVARWNQNHPDLQVMEGDRIVKVNSISGSALELLRECRRRNVLQIRVLRNARPELLAALVSAFCTAHNVQTADKAPPAAGVSSSSAVVPAAASQAGHQRRSCGRRVDSCNKVVPVPKEAQSTTPTGQRQPAQALSSTLTIADPSALICIEVSAVLRSVAQTLTFNPKVKSVHMVEGAMGSSSAINVELPPSHDHDDVQGISALAKSTFLEAAAQSQNTYIVGYLGTPFCAVGDLSFRCTIARVPDNTTACWDFYQKGFCPRPSSCRWCHPEGANLMTVWVNLKL